MKRAWWYRFSFLIFLVIVAILFVVPTTFKFDENSHFPIKSKITLGLDLQGGLYMILGIDFKKVYVDEVKSYLRKLEYTMKDQDIQVAIGTVDSSDQNDPSGAVTILDPQKVDKAKDVIREYYAGVLRLVKEDGNSLSYALNQAIKVRIEEQSVSKSIEVIRNRIDEFGVTEPEIISQGKDRIIVQLPGVKDIERAKGLIGQTAKLEFRLVNDTVSPASVEGWLKKVSDAGIIHKKGESFIKYVAKVNELLKPDLPEGYELAFEKIMNKVTNEIQQTIPYVVESSSKLGGDDLADASVQIDQQKNEPYVAISFQSSGAKRFEELTGANIGKRMAVILDGNVYTAPVIQAKIGGGHAQITLGNGNFEKLMREARDIALVLRAGALPVQLDFLEQRVIGPSLGGDSIKKANVASVVACVVLFIFAIFYYRMSGFIAVGTLVLNVLFVLACLAAFEATLTLPGIAGIALTVGMAIDGNIIIYERIRELIRAGVTNYKAVEGGFQHAFWTIVDANVTTALAGFCLLNFGTGPVRGFAVTLLIGITATVYTAYFVNKIVFDFYMNKVEGQDLSI